MRSWVDESPSTRDYKLILFLLRNRGIRYFFAKNRYDDDFYADLAASRAGYEKLAELIYATFEPTSQQGAHLPVGGGMSLYLPQCLEGAVNPG